MQILVSGASGFVGTALVKALREQGHSVQRLVRSASKEQDAVFWNYKRSHIDEKNLVNPDVVVHLAGENVASGLWTNKKKQKILRSRVESTRFLAEFFAGSDQKPKQMICASAIGIYGDAGDKILDEESKTGDGFLAEVVSSWENALEPARAKNIPTLHIRIGLVLSKEGGVLGSMLTPFKLGLGGKLGTGNQYMSWITRRDLVRVFLFAMERELVGVLNAVSPHPVTNMQFTKALGRVLRRPTFCAVPSFILQLLPGGMGKEMFLSSTRVAPKKLLGDGFVFQDQELEATLAKEV